MDINQLQTTLANIVNKLSPGNAAPKKIVIALSGGADSVFLLHQLVALQQAMPLKLIAAHLQHDWRGQPDEADAQFCAQLANQYGIAFVTATAASIKSDKKWNGSREEEGRLQRQQFLLEVKAAHAADAIMLGHHAQDQEETFFIRLLRGASLEGLCGIRQINGHFIHPLLNIEKKVIEGWLTAHNQPWCTDSDNLNQQFLRNRIRHELLPVLRRIDSRFSQNFARLVKQLEQEQGLISLLVEQTYHQIITGPQEIGDLKAFQELKPMLQGHVLKKMLFAHKISFNLSTGFIEEALKFLNTPRGGKHELGKSWLLIKKQNTFYIENR